MADLFAQFLSVLYQFLFYYPFFMAYLWMIGALFYFRHWEAGPEHRVENVPALPEYPPVSIIVPCYNEGANVEETIQFLVNQKYPAFEIIAVNDGSSDQTGRMLDALAERHPPLRVVHLAKNQGKAMALSMGALMSKNEYLICIDGDALLDQHATTWIISHFLQGPRVGAVTGNPRVRTRSTLLGKIQVGEFSAIIGMIKRAQRIYGRVFTVSGVVSGFRKSALQQIGYWSLDTVTEDIDISWKLQMNHWDIRFEPNALCWILMPETIIGLWRQRLRWAQGGMEALIRYGNDMFSWRKRRMWGVCLEYFVSILWAYSMALVAVIWAARWIFPLPEILQIPSLIPGWHGVVLGTTCLVQFAVSLVIDSRYEKGIGKVYYWMVWYPMAYWLLSVFTTVVAVPKAVFKKHERRGRWESPDRGLRP
ncbi:poly-beta-1,6-N-acetyl-D-glucosamine synthase [Candidatus Manganitrophus noduliformans]|uniref:Poly-beta-1,6-N-acetyl-D-glucosamine synthase n=1 Tax=Candidatus Manganitrophus noduliformans TaxID=2606439 RepID=A0A7X6DPT7_9BACT|nr:poly-beta-1,6-N-acetyl-D-glucosamine synthase [Candidatus Manganitrophus noduliformans]NKE71131.1 poly-beta-1,6 N-acetyl-D-glucosamine synthase [Candidatus Manganitrophus noduliformans]